VKSIKDLPGLFKETGAFKTPLEIFRSGIVNDEGYKYTQEDMEDIARNFHILKQAGIDPSKFSEKAHFITYFYEPPQGESRMNAEAIKKMLIEKGISPELVNGMDDTTLLSFVDVCKSISTDNSDDQDDDEKKKAEEAAKLKAAEDEEEKKKTEEGKTSYAEMEKRLEASINSGLAKIMSKFSEKNADMKTAAEELNKVAATAKAQIKLSSFSEVVTKVTTAGMPPAINDQGKLTFIAEALAGLSTVKKFGEVEKTPYDVFSEFIAQLPAYLPKKGEKGELSHKDKAKEFSEHESEELDNLKATYSKYSETFKAQGTSQEELSKAFKLQLKANPELTAKEFLGLAD
jgi:hypothetical protein